MCSLCFTGQQKEGSNGSGAYPGKTGCEAAIHPGGCQAIAGQHAHTHSHNHSHLGAV
ncbi:hypothetical protein PGIGA_G00218220 [Pangasianodon gigas]|uniref:Uncharacterized protein n=1 Tax=Pangasianodon gigas TaxID=30993 RepID=A0ACC5WIL4_PANGG|nr:hypothetical protein [Pangasianodon gigas]